MSAGRDVNGIVRSWLRTDERESADAILGIVLSRLDTTPQRRSWWPARRIQYMTFRPLTTLVAAAVVVAIVGATTLLATSMGIGGPPPASPSAEALPTPSATSLGEAGGNPTPLPAGVYRVDGAFQMPFRMTLPGRWYIAGIQAGKVSVGGVFVRPEFIPHAYPGFSVLLVERLYTDPCHPEEGATPTAGGPPDVDEIQRVLSHGSIAPAGPVIATTVGGYQARYFELSGRPQIGDALASCTDSVLTLLETVAGDKFTSGGWYRNVVWIVDAQRPVVIFGDSDADADHPASIQLEEIVASLTFD